MFGFTRLFQQDTQSMNPADRSAGVLISKEDIYRENRGLEPILLLRKGYEITTEELPRLIRNGARPHQFQFKTQPELLDYSESLQPRNAHEPQERPLKKSVSLRPLASMDVGQHKKTVMILDPDQKSIKRLVDCLFICGLSLNRIHPVRMSDHLSWTLKKYKPQILFIDYNLSGQQTGLDILESLPEILMGQTGLETVIMTLSQNSNLTEAEKRLIAMFCETKNIAVLEKPISRFALKRIFSSTSPMPI